MIFLACLLLSTQLLQPAAGAIELGSTPLTAADLHQACVEGLNKAFYDVVPSSSGIYFVEMTANDTTGVEVAQSTIGTSGDGT